MARTRCSISENNRALSASVTPPGVRMVISISLWSSSGRKVFPTPWKSGTTATIVTTASATIAQRCPRDQRSTSP
jgi:hypothetical protein